MVKRKSDCKDCTIVKLNDNLCNVSCTKLNSAASSNTITNNLREKGVFVDIIIMNKACR